MRMRPSLERIAAAVSMKTSKDGYALPIESLILMSTHIKALL